MSFIIYFFIFEIAIGLFLFYDGFLSSFVGRKRRATTRDLNFVPSSKFDANQVLPNLYIGSYSAALDITTLKKLGVEAIVTLGSKFKPIYKEEKLMSVDHLIVTVHDKPDANLLTSLEAISDFIHDSLRQEKVVLIHCRKGKSRSATALAAYLMKYHDFDNKNSIEFIKKFRPIVKPNKGFREQLRMFGNILRSRDYVNSDDFQQFTTTHLIAEQQTEMRLHTDQDDDSTQDTKTCEDDYIPDGVTIDDDFYEPVVRFYYKYLHGTALENVARQLDAWLKKMNFVSIQ